MNFWSFLCSLFLIKKSVNGYDPAFLSRLQTVPCANCDTFLPSNVGFVDYKTNPYPKLGYDTTINKTANCYANVLNGTSYENRQLLPESAAALNETLKGTLYLTHTGQCGVCSTLKDLAVYLSTDLTSSVRGCGLKSSDSDQIQCLLDLGFTEQCAYIWHFNTINTRKECLGVCIGNLNSPNNQPNKGFFGSNPCDTCANTINNQRTCYPEASQEGSPLRLNACLQCDECKSGPIFQKISGRTRRNTGVSSEIKRPEGYISQVDHVYGALFQ